VVLVVKAVSQMDALVLVSLVVGRQRSKNPQFYPRGVPILLDRSNDFDGTLCILLDVICFNDLSKRTLSEKLDDSV
jgi:hypothetical protein